MNVPVEIANIYTPAEAEALRRYADDYNRWIDGRTTAGPIAAGVKSNLQLDEYATRELRANVVGRLMTHELFHAITRPKHIGIMFSKYLQDDGYGLHVDDSLIGEHRRDISFTISLSDPSMFAGGDLVIESPFGETCHRPAAGTAVVYPATTLHRVEPIISGERVVIVGWVRSYIRDAAQRELLFELDLVKAKMYANYGRSTEVDLLSKCSANLKRMWLED